MDSINGVVLEINKILKVEIVESVVLMFENNKEKFWVQEGLTLHTKKNHCLFCGAPLDEKRKESLSLYFNDSVKKLTQDIISYKESINSLLEQLDKIPFIDKSQFLQVHQDKIDDLNARLGHIKSDIGLFLKLLLQKLKDKKENVFLSAETVELFDMKDVNEFIDSYNLIYEQNYEEHNSLNSLREKYKTLLRNYLIFKECESFGYDLKKAEFDREDKLKNDLGRIKCKKQAELKKAEDELHNLKQQTVNENLAVEYINNSLLGLGNQSFRLKKDNDNITNGCYQILNYEGNIRKIESLSTGEKNIVAFLWFVHDLNNIRNKSSKQQIVVFDDPMNSNDDTTQYLIITKLQQLLKDAEKDGRQIFILTHNIHFYVNTRYNWWKRDKDKKATFRLIKNGVLSDVISIEKESEDIKTSYDSLWQEVKWLSQWDKPEYLLNPIRRILETYQKFNCINDLYKNYKEAEKLFNVNSHAIDDFEADLNGKDTAEIIEMFRQVFIKNKASAHFKTHWADFVE